MKSVARFIICHFIKEPKVKPTVEVILERPLSVQGDQAVTKLKTSKSELAVAGVFIVGAETSPNAWYQDWNEENFIKVNRNMETNLPGIFAAGDCTVLLSIGQISRRRPGGQLKRH